MHSDLKPENILIGSNELDSPASSIVYLVDFGVSQRYLNTHGGHLEKVNVPFRGNLLFASPFALIPICKFVLILTFLRTKQKRRLDFPLLFALLFSDW